MQMLATVALWILVVTPIGPNKAPDSPKTTFSSQDECGAAAQRFMIDHQFVNWQGLKMNQLIRVHCERIDEVK